ncbi:MAG: hypothetical protein JST16_14705 [Bdellovibrionales bacterium]|nr:hypothetical protein [Bdellovibrionales bacterium]
MLPNFRYLWISSLIAGAVSAQNLDRRQIVASLKQAIPQDTFYGFDIRYTPPVPCQVNVAHNFIVQGSSEYSDRDNIHISAFNSRGVDAYGRPVGDVAKFEAYAQGGMKAGTPDIQWSQQPGEPRYVEVVTTQNTIRLGDGVFVMQNGQYFRQDNSQVIGTQMGADGRLYYIGMSPLGQRVVYPSVQRRCAIKMQITKGRISAVGMTGCGADTGNSQEVLSCSSLKTAAELQAERAAYRPAPVEALRAQARMLPVYNPESERVGEHTETVEAKLVPPPRQAPLVPLKAKALKLEAPRAAKTKIIREEKVSARIVPAGEHRTEEAPKPTDDALPAPAEAPANPIDKIDPGF